MSARGGIVLVNSSVIGSTAQAALSWIGGRTVFSVCASQYGTSVQLQVQGLGPQANWIPVMSSVVADQLFAFDAPPGQYRIVSAGSSIGLCAGLTGVSHS